MPILTLFWLLLSFPIRQFHQGDTDFVPSSWTGPQGCSAMWEMAAQTPCRTLLANLRNMSSPANPCPCLLIHQRENTEKEELYLLKEQYQPTNWHSDRTYTEHISVRNLLTPSHRDFAISSLRFSQSRGFAILPKERSWHLERMTPSGLWVSRGWDLVTWPAVRGLCCSLPSRTFPLCSPSYSAFLNLLILKWV